jgi:hypothetical protein
MPWTFGRLTPREFGLMVEGFQRRDRRSWRRVAQLAAWVLQPYSKKALKASALLGERPRAVRREDDE